MKSFLWSQSATLTGKDFFVIDGIVSQYNREHFQNEAMAFMTDKDFKVIEQHQGKHATTLSYRISEKKDAIQLAGNYLERDECGRYLVYVLSIKSKAEEDVVNTLQDYSNKIGCTLNKEDLAAFRLFFKKKRRKILIRRLICWLLIASGIGIAIMALIKN